MACRCSNFCLGMYDWTDCPGWEASSTAVRLLIWPRPTSWSCHTLNLTTTPLRTLRWRQTRCAFEGCSSSRYGQAYKVGFDQFCSLDELWIVSQEWKAPRRPNDQATLHTHISGLMLEARESRMWTSADFFLNYYDDCCIVVMLLLRMHVYCIQVIL